MLFSHATYIGIDPTAGQRPFTYAALDQNLELLALGQGQMEEVTAFAGGQRVAYVTINSPRQPNQGLMKEESVREKLNPTPHPGRWLGYRVAEYQLSQHNITIPRTPGDKKHCPRWMQMGFQVFSRLESIGYKLFPANAADCQLVETYPHGVYCALLGLTPFPKHSLEGRIQRQLVLHELNMKIPNPMRIFEEITRHRLLNGILELDTLYSPEELDALAGAYTAWQAANHPDEITFIGDQSEGQIVLPIKNLKSRYQSAVMN